MCWLRTGYLLDSGHSFWPPHAARATSPHRVVLRNTRVAQLADACE